MMNRILRTIVLVFLVLFLVVASISSLNDPDVGKSASAKKLQEKLNQESPSGIVVASNNGVTKVINDINSMPLKDNLEIYKNDDPGSIVTMYVTVRRGNTLEKTDHSWYEVNDATKFFFEKMEHVSVPKAEAILQVGDENGPIPGEIGYGSQVPNATIQIRGSSTSMMPQKSYRLSLFDGAGDWRGHKTINLNKHIYDPTRMKNKLAYDLIKEIPNMVSLRTQFVHLYVKDETAIPPKQSFEDYGLFTQIEQPNTRFLKNHLLDRYGQFYKAIMFEFYRYPEQIRMTDDPLYSEIEFEKVLEIKGNKDHSKLIDMLDDVNNWTIPIEQVFEKYFDADNYFTWMAFNILVENVDTNAQNFYLYSPQNGQKWYFIPWDYDGSFDRQENIEQIIKPYEYGVLSYWNGILHRRVLSVPAYRAKLDAKIHELMEFLTPERINSMMAVYRPVVEPYVSRMPDELNLSIHIEDYDRIYSLVPDEPQVNYELYLESLESPMPFYLGTPEDIDDELLFMWEESYDFNAQDLTYHFQLSKNWDFTNLLYDVDLVNINQYKIPMLETGTYYWRVQATNENGITVNAFDYYVDSIEGHHYGIKYLFITPEGEIIEKERE